MTLSLTCEARSSAHFSAARQEKPACVECHVLVHGELIGKSVTHQDVLKTVFQNNRFPLNQLQKNGFVIFLLLRRIFINNIWMIFRWISCILVSKQMREKGLKYVGHSEHPVGVITKSHERQWWPMWHQMCVSVFQCTLRKRYSKHFKQRMDLSHSPYTARQEKHFLPWRKKTNKIKPKTFNNTETVTVQHRTQVASTSISCHRTPTFSSGSRTSSCQWTAEESSPVWVTMVSAQAFQGGGLGFRHAVISQWSVRAKCNSWQIMMLGCEPRGWKISDN